MCATFREIKRSQVSLAGGSSKGDSAIVLEHLEAAVVGLMKKVKHFAHERSPKTPPTMIAFVICKTLKQLL